MTDVRRRYLLKALGCAGALMPMSALVRPAHAVADIPSSLTETRVLMGTIVTITLSQAPRDLLEEAMNLAFMRMEEHIRIFDRFDPASPLSHLNRSGTLGDAPAELTAMVRRAQKLHKLSAGAFDITVLPLVELFRRHSKPTGVMTLDPAELREIQTLVGVDGLRVDGHRLSLTRQGMGVTLDGIAKGFIADEASRCLTEAGVTNHLINAGGDIVARGEKTPGQAWTVAVERPGLPGNTNPDYASVLTLRDRAIATSGCGQIFYDASRHHHHLISPQTGASPIHMASTTVLAPSAQEADALATTLAVMPAAQALDLVASLPGRECLLLPRSGGSLTSPYWPGQSV